MSICPICNVAEATSKHHLYPRSVQESAAADKLMKKRGRWDDEGPILLLCRKCHSFIHEKYSNRTLLRRFNMLNDLQHAPEVMCRFRPRE